MSLINNVGQPSDEVFYNKSKSQITTERLSTEDRGSVISTIMERGSSKE